MLLKCFAGCGALDILNSLGLNWSALFPEGGHHSALPSQSKIPAADLLVILDHEMTVAVLILHEIVTNRAVSQGHVDRLMQSAARISKARVIANPAKVIAQ